MKTKYNEYLDISEGEDVSDQDSEREDLQDSRFARLGASTKRRKISTTEISDSSDEEDDFTADQSVTASHDDLVIQDSMPADGPSADLDTPLENHNHLDSDDSSDHNDQADHDVSPHRNTQEEHGTLAESSYLPTKQDQKKEINSRSLSNLADKPLNPASAAAAQLKASRAGVVYLSRIPPFMKPATLRTLLSRHGAVERIFLTPEAPATHARRVRSGGNRKRTWADGWVEFRRRREARACAEALNGQIIGGRKSGFYHDDVWSIKYLRGFTWADLMHGVADEERTHEARLRAEISRETRERRAFLANYERAKTARGMDRKRKEKAAAADMIEAADHLSAVKSTEATIEAATLSGRQEAIDAIPSPEGASRAAGPLSHGAETGSYPKKHKSLLRGHEHHFRQNEVRIKALTQHREQSDDIKRVLGKIF